MAYLARLSLRPNTVLVDKSPIDFETKAGLLGKLQVTVAQFRVLAKETERQRVGLRAAV